jgi:AraC-like DNA-binding protein
MLKTKDDILSQKGFPLIVSHPKYKGYETFECLLNWMLDGFVFDLPKLKIEIKKLDYLKYSSSTSFIPPMLKFMQDSYKLWYQIEGFGILQNATRNIFGYSKPGLLGIMEIGERYTYLHQKGDFECFLMDFSLKPSKNAKCYWNSEIEGKTVLKEEDKIIFENYIFDCINVISQKNELLGLASLSRIMEIIVTLFKKEILLIEESQFPKNKQKSFVDKAKHFMKLNYAKLKNQSLLEKECGVDINYLNIIFYKQTGKTLYQFLTDIRMEHAKYFLEENILSINEISNYIGYPNANSFTRAFKKYLQISPTEYKKKYLNTTINKTTNNSSIGAY